MVDLDNNSIEESFYTFCIDQGDPQLSARSYVYISPDPKALDDLSSQTDEEEDDIS